MVKIRLKRMGAKKRPVYRIVVADSRSPRDGRFIESIGTYDPMPDPPKTVVDADKVKEWLRKGARPSDSARFILEREGLLPKSARPVRPAREETAPAESPVADDAVPVAVAEVGEPESGGE